MTPRSGVVLFAGPARDLGHARGLINSGASAVLVRLVPHPIYGDFGLAELDELFSWPVGLRVKSLCLSLVGKRPIQERLEWCERLRPRFIELDLRFESMEVIRVLAEGSGAGLVLSGFELDYDADPAWTIAQIREMAEGLSLEHVVVSLLPGLEDPFGWLRDEAGAYEEDVTLADVAALVDDGRVLVNFSGTSDFAAWLGQALPDGSAYYLLEGDDPANGNHPTTVAPDRLGGFIAALTQKR